MDLSKNGQKTTTEKLESMSELSDEVCGWMFSAILRILRERKGIIILATVAAHVFFQRTWRELLLILGWGFSGNTFWLSGRFIEKPEPCPCDMKIPKIIHQTYKTTVLPGPWRDTPMSWRRLHQDWRYQFWTDEDGRKLIEDHYPWFLEQFNSYDAPIQRADAMRYFILHRFGGVYSDLDIKPTRNIEQLLQDEKLVLFQTPNLGVTNSLMASVPGHQFWEYVHEDLKVWRDHVLYPVLPYMKIVQSTGPTLLWHAYASWNETTKYEEIAIADSSMYGKVNWCHNLKPGWFRRDRANEDWFDHVDGSRWHSQVESFNMRAKKIAACAPVPSFMIFTVLASLFCIGYGGFCSRRKRTISWVLKEPTLSFAAIYFGIWFLLVYFT